MFENPLRNTACSLDWLESNRTEILIVNTFVNNLLKNQWVTKRSIVLEGS